MAKMLGAEADFLGSAAAESVSVKSLVDYVVDTGSEAEVAERDPRKIARKYQLELCKKAVEENIIVYLGTGCGKTHIAVLLIYEFGHLIRKPQKNICIFLAPTVALVQQQAKVIEDSTDFKVGVHCGSSNHLNTHDDWEKEIEQYEVLAMTPDILLRNLNHCFIRMELIALLIFDECHHAQVKSNHSYAQIMKAFYKTNVTKLPRVFGMTASPVVGKDASNQANLSKSINSLENLLDAKVYTVEDEGELEHFVASPTVKVYYYGPVANSLSNAFSPYCSKLEEMKRQCISTLSRKKSDLHILLGTKRMLFRIHDTMIFCLENLGLWGALHACSILLSGNQNEWDELIEAGGNQSDDSVCNSYLTQAAQLFSLDCMREGSVSELSCIEILKEPFFSKKFMRLIGILSNFRSRPNMKCIVFVNRIVTARSLSYILHQLKFLAYWKCDFLVGIHSGFKSMSRKSMKIILQKFRSGELNLLVATKVGEEGLDIQTCCLVIRFDLPETVSSFIQSRGRARMPQSEFAFLVDSGNQKELDLIENFRKDEDRMNREISCRTSSEIFIGDEDIFYRVDSTGASISCAYSISLLHQYCSKLPHDEYFDPKPTFFYFDDLGGTVCHITMPSNAPMCQIVGTPQPSPDAAKKIACLKSIEELHKLGALNDFLLPIKDDANTEELELTSSDSDSCEDDDSRGEIHEMLVPAVLKWPVINSNHLILHSYYIKFKPDPEDRVYKEFGLFLKEPLPQDAERMELDLHLARGRSVMATLVPLGVMEFINDEINLAENFQEMFLKLILDRSEYVPEVVHLGTNYISTSSSSTFYLLLPVILQDIESSITIDWKTIRRCLSSPVFRNPAHAMNKEYISFDTHLQLADGCRSIKDIENSLVYVRHKDTFFFVTNVDCGKSGYSLYKNSEISSHADHLFQNFSIQLQYPGQPLLRAKPLFSLHNLLHNRKQNDLEAQHLEEYFIDLPPEICHLKIIGFSKDLGSSLSLLPSMMHRLENFLVAIELKCMLSASFPEGAKVTAERVLEALTTENCQECFSLERLEVLGDAFLKFVVGRNLFVSHDTLDEGELTRRRSNVVSNSNLFKLAIRKNLQVYVRDQPFEPSQFYTLGRPCPTICNKEVEQVVCSHNPNGETARASSYKVRCSKGHHWLLKKTVSDAVEALVGAFIVDSGFTAAMAFLRWIGIKMDFKATQLTNFCIASTRYNTLAEKVDISSLENSIGYQFLHKGLLLQAFVHPSYNKLGGGCYQRLEYLGDAVLDYLMTSYLYSVYPKLKPGQLTDLRSVFVNNKAFANVAVDRSLHEFLICDSTNLSEDIENYVVFFKRTASEKGPLEGPRCPKALGDLVESTVGAILLDTGFDLNKVWSVMISLLDPIMKFPSFQVSSIRELHELCQSRGWDLKFNPTKKSKMFLVEAEVKGEEICARASDTKPNKKEAMQIAAQRILTKLKAKGYELKSKSLEEVLRSTHKMEPKLMGYDETPITVIAPEALVSEKAKDQEPFGSNSNLQMNLLCHDRDGNSNCIRRFSKQPVRPIENHNGDNGSPSSGGSHKATTRSWLYEICAANHWKPPSFDCIREEGPSHMKLFTYKATVEMEDCATGNLECLGSAKESKKAAADHAAEGVIWYLKNEGYMD